MRAKFKQERFAEALENVAKVLPAKSLAGSEEKGSTAAYVLVSAQRPDTIVLTATDSETTVSAVFAGAEIEEEGSELLLASDLFQVLHASPVEDVAIRSEEKTVRLTVGPLVYRCIRKDDAKSFPSRYAPRSAEPIGSANAKDLANLFRKTVLATDSGLGTGWWDCVRLEFEQNEIIGVGNDGRRMVVQKIPYEPASNAIVDPILVSDETAKLAQKLLGKQNGRAGIFKTAEQVQFSTSWTKTPSLLDFHELVVAGTLNHGYYPPWRRALPKTDPAWSGKVKINSLSEELKKMRGHARNDDNVFLSFEAGALTMLPGDQTTLRATKIPVDSDGEKEVHMTFSYKLLRSILGAFKSSATVVVNVWGDEMPLVLRTDGCQCAVMPRRWPKPSGTF